jgi:hypothetical protein
MAVIRRGVEWDAPAQIWALLAETNRNRKERSKPFTFFDIHPLLERSQEEARPLREAREHFRDG